MPHDTFTTTKQNSYLPLYSSYLLFFIIVFGWVLIAAGGLSLAVASRDYSLVAMHGGLLTAAAYPVAKPRLQGRGLGGMVHGLICPTACGIFPDHGLNLCPLHCQGDSLPLDHP